MFVTEGRLYVHGVSAERWTARYGVEPFSHPCSQCGEMLTTSLPFVQGRIHGLAAPPCKCGNDCTPYAILMEDLPEPPPRTRRVRPTKSGVFACVRRADRQ